MVFRAKLSAACSSSSCCKIWLELFLRGRQVRVLKSTAEEWKVDRGRFPFFLMEVVQMKGTAKLLTVLALTIFFSGSVEASDLTINSANVIEQANIVPQRHRRFVPPIDVPHRTNAPRRDYPSRRPAQPTLRQVPDRARPSQDNRGSGRGKFQPPQAPRR